MSTNTVYLIAGVALLLAVVLPSLLERWAVSAAMVLLFVGMGVGLLPMPQGLSLDPITIRPQIQHVTELTVLVALMGVGLAIDRPINLRRPRSWASWSPTWRLLAIAMPLSIASVWGLGDRSRSGPGRRVAARLRARPPPIRCWPATCR